MDMCERDGLPIEKANKDPSTERTLPTFNLRLNTSMSQNCIITFIYIYNLNIFELWKAAL